MLTIGSNLSSPIFFFGNGIPKVLPLGTVYVIDDNLEKLVDDSNEFVIYENPVE